MDNETRDRLELLIEKAEKLKSFGLEDHVREVGLGFSANRQKDGTWVIELGLPDDEKRDAFLLTFRFFHQRNERISFQRLHELAEDPDISDHWRTHAHRLQREYFDYLNDHSDYTANLFEGGPTRDLMLDIGLYGGLIHANRPNKVRQYRQWTRDELQAGLFHQEFTRILLRVLEFIEELAEISRSELQ